MKLRPTTLFWLLLFSFLFALGSCNVQPKGTSDSDASIFKVTANEDIEIVAIDGHDYVVFWRKRGYGAGGGICHSEACSCKNN